MGNGADWVGGVGLGEGTEVGLGVELGKTSPVGVLRTPRVGSAGVLVRRGEEASWQAPSSHAPKTIKLIPRAAFMGPVPAPLPAIRVAARVEWSPIRAGSVGQYIPNCSIDLHSGTTATPVGDPRCRDRISASQRGKSHPRPRHRKQLEG